MKRVKEFSYVELHEKPPTRLRWAFRRWGKGYIVRGAGKIYEYDVQPRWGWDKIYEMINKVFKIQGRGGYEGVESLIAKEFKVLYDEYVRRERGYLKEVNKKGSGRILLHRYKPQKTLELPAEKSVLSFPEETLYLNYILHLLGFKVEVFLVPTEGFFINKMYLDTENRKLWHLAYIIFSGAYGYGRKGFMVNTPVLFEEYVGCIYGGRRFKGSGFIKPDFILEDGTPLDAKYKTKVNRSDIYQAFAYAKVLGVNRAILVYPDTEPLHITLEEVSIFIESMWG